MPSEEVQKHSVHTLVFRSLKRTHDMFISSQGTLPPLDEESEEIKRLVKMKDMFGPVVEKVKQQRLGVPPKKDKTRNKKDGEMNNALIDDDEIENYDALQPYSDNAIVALPYSSSKATQRDKSNRDSTVAIRKKPITMPRPKWHPPWKLYRVISGHLGWVRCVTMEPGNEWFATGSADRVIKIWELATGKLKLSLTGHVSTVRGLAVSDRHPYLFSCGEDKQVKCWDLEYNRVVRHYHGHLSAVYSLALHPGLDILVTAGRDATARVWDMRTKANVHTLTGHTNTISSVISQIADPQVVTSSHDCTIRLWDLAAGKSMATLTHHKKSVRSIVFHPTLYMFGSASPDSIKQWKCPEGKFVQNLSGHNAIINCLAVNPDGVLISGADNGSMYCWDWRTGYNFQRMQAPVQPGSMDSESGIFSMTFDQSGSRLITTEADKTIKIYKPDDKASEDTHPINWKLDIINQQKY